MSAELARETLAPLTELPTELTLRTGTAQALELPSLAGGGYVWRAEVDDGDVAEVSTQFRPANRRPGGGETFSRTELLTVRGLRAGTTHVHLSQGRTWEQGVEPVATHTLKVNVVAPATE